MSFLEIALLALAALLLLALLANAVLLWLGSRLVTDAAPDEVYKVACEDGWVVELARYRGTRPDLPPVVFAHGIGANATSLDLDEEVSLPRFLRARGFDCWLLDLRGRGGSAKPPAGRGAYDYDFEDHARYDAKAAIELVRRETGAPKVAWIGHSMGGMTAYGYAEIHGDEALQAVVVCGSPVDWSSRPILAPVAGLARLQRLPALYYVLAARIASPLAGYYNPFLARLIINAENVTPRVMRIGLARGLANIARRPLHQLAHWIRTGELQGREGRIFFRDLGKITVPWFAIGGAADHLVPPENVRVALDRLGSREKRWLLAGKASGHAHDYGHIDLLLGSRCREEIYTPIAEFLEGVRCSPAAVPTAALGRA
jgi:pimeloyl-ACP methyl ester carboxylesterase